MRRKKRNEILLLSSTFLSFAYTESSSALFSCRFCVTLSLSARFQVRYFTQTINDMFRRLQLTYIPIDQGLFHQRRTRMPPVSRVYVCIFMCQTIFSLRYCFIARSLCTVYASFIDLGSFTFRGSSRPGFASSTKVSPFVQ